MEEDEYFSPPAIDTKIYDVCSIMLPFTDTITGYHYLVGSFPYKASIVNQYIFVLYYYDTNAILSRKINNKQVAGISDAFQYLYNILKAKINDPNLYIIDNEASSKMKEEMIKYEISYQLAPPHMHRRNAAKRDIWNFKNHFVAVFATTDPEFPIIKWYRLLDQAVTTLNLLQNSCFKPNISAYVCKFGQYDFN